MDVFRKKFHRNHAEPSNEIINYGLFEINVPFSVPSVLPPAQYSVEIDLFNQETNRVITSFYGNWSN